MKQLNQIALPHVRQGFTIIELTVAILIGLMIAMMTLVLFNQQLMMFSTLRTQNFMVHEAPQINLILNKLIPKADSLLIYATASDVNGGTPIKEPGKAVALRFTGSNIASTTDSELGSHFGVIAIVGPVDEKTLNYYANLSDLSKLDAATPSWKISTKVKDASFFLENGVLRIKLTGPKGGEITYSATAL